MLDQPAGAHILLVHIGLPLHYAVFTVALSDPTLPYAKRICFYISTLLRNANMTVMIAGVCEHRSGCQCWWSKSFDVNRNIYTGTGHIAAHPGRYSAGNTGLLLPATLHQILRVRVVCLTMPDPALGLCPCISAYSCVAVIT